MERARLATWREVSRHLDLGESVPNLHAILREATGARWMLVRRWDDEHGSLRTVGASGAPGLPARQALPGPTAAAVRTWASLGAVTAWHERSADRVARALVPEGLDGPVLGVPIVDAEGLHGVVLVGGVSTLDPDLVDAFAVALANDQRLHELARLREAAEADRRALLQRLGRQAVTEGIVGAESGLREVMARVNQVAGTDVPVLILGETGSGKEVIARAVHERSPRARGPFLRVNCGAIPPELVDSELFGHERGAFTGAIGTRRGWFERADGGTLFLDEVGELPAAAQVRLLRVLQDGSFQRVGGQESRSVDVRIVAATHRDLHALVRDGNFRQDLWYRVSVFPLRIPPLRERPGDIPALAAHFAALAGERLFGAPLVPSPADHGRLVAYAWPGNVRELAAVVERAAILGDGKHLDVATALGVAGPIVARAPTVASDPALIEALRACHGRIEGPFGAAARLGVNPFTLRSRLRRLGIDWSAFRSP